MNRHQSFQTPLCQQCRRAQELDYDVFLSHSTKDKPVVRELAARLHSEAEVRRKKAEMELPPWPRAFGSDWALLETGTFRLRNPLNRERRFIPLRLDDFAVNDISHTSPADQVDKTCRTDSSQGDD